MIRLVGTKKVTKKSKGCFKTEYIMKLTRKQLRNLVINELFGFGKKKKKMTPDETFLDALRTAFNGKFKNYNFENVDQVIKVNGNRAAIGTSKSSMPQAARDMSSADGMRKLKLQGSYSGISKPFTKTIAGKTYTLVVVPEQ